MKCEHICSRRDSLPREARDKENLISCRDKDFKEGSRMALVLQTADQTAFGDESTRRRSTFYVPLSTEDLRDDDRAADVRNGNEPAVFNPNLSGYSCDWSLNDSIDGSEMLISREKSQLSSDDSNRLKRYGIVLNGSVDIDDSNLEVHANYKRKNSKNLHSSTPIKSPQPDVTQTAAPPTTPARLPKTVIIVNSITPIASVEKSKTLPVKDTQPSSSTFPPKNTFILKSTPKISSSINYSSLSDCSPLATTKATNAPKKSLSFIRRAHSTKLSRNNSLLKSLATKCGAEHSNDSLNSTVYDLSTERLMLYMRSDNCDDLMKELFFRVSPDSSQLEHCGKNKENEHDDEDGLSGKNSEFNS